MWRLVRTWMRQEILGWVRREFTKDRIQGMLEGWLKERMVSKTMIRKVAVATRAAVLAEATVDASGNVAITADGAQTVARATLERVIEQVM